MTRAGRSLGLQFLMERRARDEAERFYREAAAEDNLTRQRAQFETRTLNRYQAGELKRRAKIRADEAEQEIEGRRKKLAQLLQQEEDQYSAEIEECVETPLKRRERLKEQLSTLRARRQQEHDDYVKEKNEQAWRDQCDPLRHQISEALTKQVIAERDKQVIEHEQKKLEDDADELAYHAQVMKNTREWREDLERERETRRQKLLQNRTTWLGQMDEHQKIAQAEKDREYQESLEFRTTVEGAIKAAKEAAEKKAAEQAARRHELDLLNTEQIGRRKAQLEEEKEIDVAYARKAAEELRQQEEDELVDRLVRQRKAEMNRRLLETQLNKKAATDEISEMYLQRAQQEANDREDELRAKDLAARRKLMLDAVADRVQTMKLHEQQKELKKLEKIEEGKQLEAELEEERILNAEEQEQRRLRIENQYRMLQTQTRIKHDREAREKKEAQDSVKAMIQGWKDEEQRIQDELQNPHYFTGGRFRGYR